jgi:hypothetical protein
VSMDFVGIMVFGAFDGLRPAAPVLQLTLGGRRHPRGSPTRRQRATCGLVRARIQASEKPIHTCRNGVCIILLPCLFPRGIAR